MQQFDAVVARTGLSPVTLQLTVRWPPQIKVINERLSIINALSETGAVKDFKVAETEVTAQLGDYCAVHLSPDALRITAADARGQAELVSLVLQNIIPRVAPPTLHHVVCAFQYVVPLPAPYLQARLQTCAALLGHWWDGPVDDYAVLLTSEDGDARTGQVEFGIISKAEIAPRLLRTAGRMKASSSAEAATVLSLYLAGELPEAAVFADCSWFSKPNKVNPDQESIEQFALDALSETSRSVRGLQGRFAAILR